MAGDQNYVMTAGSGGGSGGYCVGGGSGYYNDYYGGWYPHPYYLQPVYNLYPVYISPTTHELEKKIADLTEEVAKLTKALKAKR